MPGPRSKRKRAETESGGSSIPRRHRRDPAAAPTCPEQASTPATTCDRIPLKKNTAVSTPSGTTTVSDNNTKSPLHTADENKQIKSEEAISEKNISEISSSTRISVSQKSVGNDHANSGAEQDFVKGPLHQETTWNHKYTQQSMVFAVPKGGAASPGARRASKVATQDQKAVAAVSGAGGGGGSTPVAAAAASISGAQPGEKSKISGGSLAPAHSIKPKQHQSREKRIRYLLSHRKLLLERLQQGRTAAQKRLNQLREEEQPPQNSETDEEERFRFASFSREITTLARRQSRSESVDPASGITASAAAVAASETTTLMTSTGGANKRVSVSLRKGPGVGKRMNAALSSLAPHHAASNPASVAAAVDSATVVTGTNPSTVPPTAIVRAASTSAVLMEDAKSPSMPPAARPVSVPVSAAATTETSNHAHTPVAPSVPSSTTPLPALSQPNLPVMTPVVASRKTTHTTKAGGRGAGQKGVRRAQSTTQQPQQSIPMQGASARATSQQLPLVTSMVSGRSLPAAAGPMFPPSNIMGIPMMRRPKVPNVTVPEAATLRERKKAIESKLVAMIAQSRTVAEAGEDRQELQGGIAPSRQQLQNEQYARDIAIRGAPGLPARLPKRRKTHWDTLLEEMRWLATDFIEERKWKRFASRAVGFAVAEEVEQRRRTSLPPPSASANEESKVISKSTKNGGGMSNGTHSKLSASKGMEKVDSVADLPAPPETRLEDQFRAQGVARKSAAMVSEFLSSCLDTNSMSVVDEDDVDDVPNITDEDGEAEGRPFKAHGSHVAEQAISADREKRHEEYAEVSEKVDKVLATIEQARGHAPPKSKEADLFPQQLAAVGFSEESWKTCSVGCVLSGPGSSGKTYATCMILWKSKITGPQLLICSPHSLVKWCHNLSYFDGIRVASHNKAKDNLDACTVVLCTYRDLAKIRREVLQQFRTVVVDSRYPVGFRGSRQKICLDKYEISSHSLLSLAAPEELSSVEWWGKVTTCIMKSNARRIIVDPFDAADLLGLFDGLSDRSVLEHLALRVAFLFGSAAFPASWSTLMKDVLGWARTHIKRSGGKGSKFVRVRSLLCSMMDTVTFRLKHKREAKFSFDVVPCEMTSSQLRSYQLCCSNVKTALSRNLDILEDSTVDFPFRAVADALIHLRKICTHADLERLLKSLPEPFTLVASSRRGTASQPDTEIALSILEGSGKFRELVNTLVQEGDVELEPEVAEITALPKTSNGISSEEGPKKIAILAVLPEIQLLISILLYSLGICHEVLLELSLPTNNSMMSSAWLETQYMLSRFNDKKSESFPTVNIIVASPLIVAGNHGGLGIESAGMVILLDEDWSGRGTLVMQALISRVSVRKDEGETVFKRLVAKDTCEQIFVSGSVDFGAPETGAHKMLPWPVSSLGILEPPKELRPREESVVKENWAGVASEKCVLSFPGRGFLGLSNSNIDAVLGSSWSCQHLFGTDKCPLFLPSTSETLKTGTELLIIKHLSQGEQAATSMRPRSPFLSATTRPPSSTKDFDFHQNDFLVELGKLPVAVYIQGLGERSLENPENSQVLLSGDRPAPISNRSEQFGDLLSRKEETPGHVLLADGLLTYEDTRKSQALNTETPGRNAFAFSYSMSGGLRFGDGGQGAEMLVYFPPIFPRLLESSIIASESVEPLRMDASNKRGRRPSIESSKLKRAKSSTGEIIPVSATAEPLPIVYEENATRNDAASVLVDLTDDYGLLGVGAIPLPRDSALFAGQIPADNSSNLIASDARLDDETLARAIPADYAEAERMRATNIAPHDTNSIILVVKRKRHRSPMAMRSQPQGQSNVQVPWVPPSGSLVGPNVHIMMGNNGTVYGVGSIAEPGAKKPKTKQNLGALTPARRDQATHSVSAVSLPPVSAAGTGPQHLQVSKIKDVHRRSLIATSRQLGPEATIFEATPFRAAAVRLRHKMSNRLSQICWHSGTAFEVGPGLPLVISKPQARGQGLRGHFEADPALWTSVVKRLKNSASRTGDEAIEVSAGHRSSLRRSLAAPSRTDFGPFNAGFLSSPLGMTAIAPPRPTLGVTLPMGVKLPQTSKDQLVPWTNKEELLLKETTIRFGFNWTLSSIVLSGLQDIVSVSRHPQDNLPIPRAAKTCREHWQSLARSDPALSKDVRKVERTQRENSTLRFHDSVDLGSRYKITTLTARGDGKPRSLLLLFPPQERSTPEVRAERRTDTLNGEDDTKPPSYVETSPLVPPRKRSFSAIISARKRYQQAPSSIPGMSTGGSPSIAPSHPSHAQSVQTSVASSWTSGRTEMWPLQFLDAHDRAQHAISAVAPSQTPGPDSRQQSGPTATIRSSLSVPNHQRSSGTYYSPPPGRGNSNEEPRDAQNFAPPQQIQSLPPSSEGSPAGK